MSRCETITVPLAVLRELFVLGCGIDDRSAEEAQALDWAGAVLDALDESLDAKVPRRQAEALPTERTATPGDSTLSVITPRSEVT